MKKSLMLVVLSLCVTGVSAQTKDVLMESSPTSNGHKVTVMEPFKVDPALLAPPIETDKNKDVKLKPVKQSVKPKPVSGKNWLD